MKYSRDEIEDIVDEASTDADIGSVLEIAERVAPGREDVREILQDLHSTYFVSDDVLQYYADRLQRALS